MVNIGIVVHNINKGGVQRVAILESKYLSYYGYNSTLFSMIKPVIKWNEILSDIKYRYVINVPFDGWIGELYSRFFSSFTILPQNFDIYVCHNLPGGHLGYKTYKRYKIPYILYMHDVSAYPIIGNPMSIFFGKYSPEITVENMNYLQKIGLKLEKKWLSNAEIVLANSKRTAKEIYERHKIKAKILYPTITLTPEYKKRDVNNFFLVVQRFDMHPTYNILYQILKKVPNMKVVIAGSKSADFLANKVISKFSEFGDRVKYIFNPSDEELKELYRKALAYIQPGIENFNMSALEAAMCGCPIIVSKESGITELFEGTDYPLFANYYDVDSFVNYVTELINDKNKSIKYGKMAQDIVKKYNRKYHMETLVEYIKEVIGYE